MRPSFTLGIEEEYQTIDPVSRDLRSHIATEMLSQGKMRLEERVKAEMHQSVVEVGTRICENIDCARDDLYDLRRQMILLAKENNLTLVAGATHPFADWRTQEIYPDPRYRQVVKDLQLVARSNLIFQASIRPRKFCATRPSSACSTICGSCWAWRMGTAGPPSFGSPATSPMNSLGRRTVILRSIFSSTLRASSNLGRPASGTTGASMAAPMNGSAGKRKR